MIRLVSRKWWVLVLRGFSAIGFGMLALLWPQVTVIVLVMLFGIFSLIDGIFTSVAALGHRREVGRWWLFFMEGLVGLGVGAFALLRPSTMTVALLYLIAVWALLTGIFEIASGVRLRKQIKGEWLLILTGVLSMVFGVLLILWPGPGLMTLVLLLAVYSILFGLLLIALGVRARRAGDALAI